MVESAACGLGIPKRLESVSAFNKNNKICEQKLQKSVLRCGNCPTEH